MNKSIFTSLPMQMLYIIVIVLLSHNHIDSYYISISYSISHAIKSMLMMILPYMIFVFILQSCTMLSHRILSLFITLMAFICISNFISTILAYYSATMMLDHNSVSTNINIEGSDIVLLWDISFLVVIPNTYGLFSGFVFGIIGMRYAAKRTQALTSALYTNIMFILNRIFVPILPIFILGFLLKLAHDGLIYELIYENFDIIILMMTLTMVYILLLYLLVNDFNIYRVISSIKNMIPAITTAFTTMSSAAALPLSIIAASKNTDDPNISRIVIPTSVNIHLIGDAFHIPIMTIILCAMFNIPIIDINHYLYFALFFVLMKFAVAAVPGGGILIMVPLIEECFGFTPFMSGIITIFYIALDPIITSFNVLGNNVLVMIYSRFYQKYIAVK